MHVDQHTTHATPLGSALTSLPRYQAQTPSDPYPSGALGLRN